MWSSDSFISILIPLVLARDVSKLYCKVLDRASFIGTIADKKGIEMPSNKLDVVAYQVGIQVTPYYLAFPLNILEKTKASAG